jgi:hypothetical protein
MINQSQISEFLLMKELEIQISKSWELGVARLGNSAEKKRSLATVYLNFSYYCFL